MKTTINEQTFLKFQFHMVNTSTFVVNTTMKDTTRLLLNKDAVLCAICEYINGCTIANIVIDCPDFKLEAPREFLKTCSFAFIYLSCKDNTFTIKGIDTFGIERKII